MQGILVINKPQGFTSMDCCAIVRKAFGEKKVGHTGTLDPNATGVLPICLGKATRLIEYMDCQSKTYIAGFRLGFTSDTEDIWGNVVGSCNQNNIAISREVLEDCLLSFCGDIMQVPPMYSAKKVNGQKLYNIARSGREIERKANKIHIYNCELIDFDGINGSFKIECSRGTYVRTICADLGKKLGCGAIMTSLVRTETCGFKLEHSIDFDEMKKIADLRQQDRDAHKEFGSKYYGVLPKEAEKKLQSFLLPIEASMQSYEKLAISEEGAKFLLNGNPKYKRFLSSEPSDSISTVFCNGKLISVLKNGKIDKVFHDSF